jgi:hypothetical protein
MVFGGSYSMPEFSGIYGGKSLKNDPGPSPGWRKGEFI